MDRRELEIMLNKAFDRGIVSVGHLVHETVEVGFLNELGRTVGFTLNGWKEAIETIPVDLFDSFDDGRGRERFLSDCKALGGKVPQNTYRGELVSALADVLMVEEAARTSSSRPAAFARIWAGPVSIRSCRFRNRTYAYTHTYAVAHTHTRTMEHMHVGISTHMHIAAHAPIGLQPRWAPCFRPFPVSGV